MSNAFWNKGKTDPVKKQIDWSGDTIKAALMTGTSWFNASSQTVWSDISSHLATGCTPTALSGQAVSSAGVVSANSVTFTGVTTGQTITAVVLYLDNGGAQDLQIFFDTGTGFPYSSTGANITVDWNGTATSGTIFTVTG